MTPSTPTRWTPRPMISKEFVDEHRRRRFVDATADLLHGSLRREVTVAQIVALAGTARNSFYENFRNTDDCIAYGAEVAERELFAVLEEQDGQGDWTIELLDGISGLYVAVCEQAPLAELLLVHSLACRSGSARTSWLAVSERLVPLLRRGRAEAEGHGRLLPPATEVYFSGVVVSLAARRLRAREVWTLPDEALQIAALVANHYLGPGEDERSVAAIGAGPVRS